MARTKRNARKEYRKAIFRNIQQSERLSSYWNKPKKPQKKYKSIWDW